MQESGLRYAGVWSTSMQESGLCYAGVWSTSCMSLVYAMQESGLRYAGVWSMLCRSLVYVMQESGLRYAGVWFMLCKSLFYVMQESGLCYAGVWSTLCRSLVYVMQESGVAGGKSSPASVVQIDDVHCEEDEDEPPNGFIRGVQALQDGGSRLWAAEKKLFIRIFLLLLLALYTAYFIWAMIVGRLRDEGSIRLCWVTCVVLVLVVISYIVKIDAVNDVIGNVRRNVAPHEEKISWLV